MTQVNVKTDCERVLYLLPIDVKTLLERNECKSIERHFVTPEQAYGWTIDGYARKNVLAHKCPGGCDYWVIC